MPTAPSVRLLTRLRALGLQLPPEAQITTLRPGRHQRDAGACRWAVEVPGPAGRTQLNPAVIGYAQVWTCATAHRLEITRVFDDLVVEPLDGLPTIPQKITLPRWEARFVNWDDCWHLLGLAEDLPVGQMAKIHTKDGDPVLVGVGEYVAERWITPRGTSQRVRLAVARQQRHGNSW